MEQIVFPVPSICEFLTKESKLRIYYTTERDEQGSKINDFFLRSEDLFNEMNWQKKLRGGWVRLRGSVVVVGVGLCAGGRGAACRWACVRTRAHVLLQVGAELLWFRMLPPLVTPLSR